MTTHLEGRMPHNEIAALFAAAARAKSADDVHALVPRLQHVSAVFASVLREFRASLPANERNRSAYHVAGLALDLACLCSWICQLTP